MKNSCTSMVLGVLISMQGVLVASERHPQPKAPRLGPTTHNVGFDEIPPLSLRAVPLSVKDFLIACDVDEEVVDGIGDYLIRFIAACLYVDQCDETDLGAYVKKKFAGMEYPMVTRALVAQMSSLQHKDLVLEVLDEKIVENPGVWSRWWPEKNSNDFLDIAQYCDRAVVLLKLAASKRQ